MKALARPALPRALVSVALAVLAACAPHRPPPVAPAPAPVAADKEEIGESAAIVAEKVGVVHRDILGSVQYDLPVEANSWVESELDFLVGQRREVIERWLQRGDYYEGFVKGVLADAGVPTDLYHLAMIESGYLPTARSHAGAVGLWQFMAGTGRALGLEIDDTVDERMDPVRSTRAAARHLRSLRVEMGTWPLAAAAYNAGSGRISRGLRAFGDSTFWDLAQDGDLTAETKHYVPRLYAMTIIGRGRERFGFAAATARGFAYDSVRVEYATPLSVVAELGDVREDDLARLNPHLLQRLTPGGGYWVWVPRGQGASLQRAWLASDFRRGHGLGVYVVRKGDYLGRIAELADVSSKRIRQLNPGVDWEHLQIDARLRLPYLAAQRLTERADERARSTRLAAREEKKAEKHEEKKAEKHEEKKAKERSQQREEKHAPPRAAAGGGGSSHVVGDGETLWAIAQRFGTSVEAIQAANGLGGSTIQPGQKLTIPAAAGEKAEPVAETAAKNAPAARVEHVVKPGETLWGIAQRYGTTVESIEAANHLGQRPIQPGQKLTIPGA